MTPFFHALLRDVPLRDIKYTYPPVRMPFLKELSDGRAKIIQPKYGKFFGEIASLVLTVLFNGILIFFNYHLTDLSRKCISFQGFNAMFFKEYYFFIVIFLLMIMHVLQQLYDLYKINKRPEFYPTKSCFFERVSVKVDEKEIKYKKRMVLISIFILVISVATFISYLDFPIKNWALENQRYNQKCIAKAPSFDKLK